MKLSAVGMGPGDPELLTVKGLNRIEEAELIFVPRSRDGSISLAQRIAQPYISPHQQVIALPLPMTRNAAELATAWDSAAETIKTAYQDHNATQAVYLLLGDPLLYGTFVYIWERLKTNAPELTIEIIPGVTSFAATAATAQTVLSTTNDRLAIIPASYETDTATLQNLLRQFDTIIFLKVGPVLPKILAAIDELGLVATTIYGERVGMPEETVITDVSKLMGTVKPYLSLLIVKKPTI